jgi:hypothetical protein
MWALSDVLAPRARERITAFIPVPLEYASRVANVLKRAYNIVGRRDAALMCCIARHCYVLSQAGDFNAVLGEALLEAKQKLHR